MCRLKPDAAALGFSSLYDKPTALLERLWRFRPGLCGAL